MIIICSGILFYFVVGFFIFSLFVDYLANFSSGFVFVLFLFEISNVAPGTKHKHKQKAKKQNQNEPKKHTIFVDLLCLSAASARSVIRVSLHLLRRVRIKRLSLANWASLSVERKTKPRERAESARESKAKRGSAREWELLPAEAVRAFVKWVCALIIRDQAALL